MLRCSAHRDSGSLMIVLHSPSCHCCQSPPLLTFQAGPRRGTRRAGPQHKNCSHATKFIGVRVRGPCHEVSRDRCHVEAVSSMRDSITSPRSLRRDKLSSSPVTIISPLRCSPHPHQPSLPLLELHAIQNSQTFTST